MNKSSSAKFSIGGIAGVLEMLRVMEPVEQKKLLLLIREKDPTLAQLLQSQIFTFEDLQFLSPKELQTLLRLINIDSLAIALRKSSDTLKAVVQKNLSQRQAKDLEDLLYHSGPKRLSEVEEQQKKILDQAKALVEEGKISLRKTKDDRVVE